MTAPPVSSEVILAIRQIDLIREDELWQAQLAQREAQRAQMARQRLVVLLGDLFQTFPALEQVWLDFRVGQNTPWSCTIRSCKNYSQVLDLAKIPWERLKETGTPEEIQIRSVFGLVRAWGQTMGSASLCAEAFFQLFPNNSQLTREEFAETFPYLLGGDRFLDSKLKEEIRIEKRGQALDDQLPAPVSSRPGPRF